MTSTSGLFIADNVIGLFFGTVFRFFAYRFWVFSETMGSDPAFAHDREYLTGQLPAVPAPDQHEGSVAEAEAEAEQGEGTGTASAPSSAPAARSESEGMDPAR